jgi:hypothetical protein
MRAGIFHRAAAACAAASASALLIGTALPAQAATPGWRQVFSKHYGTAHDYSAYEAIVATAKNNAWAFGATDISGVAPTPLPVAERWNGKEWSAYALPKGVVDPVFAASAPAANDIWAVTQFGGYVLHWNGKGWSLAKRLPRGNSSVPPQLTGVVALSATNVWVFGSSGYTSGWGTWHYNGRSWSQWHGNAVDITDGSALSPANIWAIGGLSAPQSAIVHYTGTWKQVSAPALSGLQFEGIQAFSATSVWASATAFSNGWKSWLVHYDGHRWSKFRLPWSMRLNWGHIVSDGQGGLWLSGSAGAPGSTQYYYEVHRSASGAWSRALVSAPVSGLAHIPGTTSLWGVGWKAARTGGNAVIWAYGAI